MPAEFVSRYASILSFLLIPEVRTRITPAYSVDTEGGHTCVLLGIGDQLLMQACKQGHKRRYW
jgi:hypothetical protein